MIFPYDSNSRFSDPKAASPTQRPASNSDARKRAGEPGFSPKDATFERELGGSDPHTDNGFAEVIRKAKAEAWDEGFRSVWEPLGLPPAFLELLDANPYGASS